MTKGKMMESEKHSDMGKSKDASRHQQTQETLICVQWKTARHQSPQGYNFYKRTTHATSDIPGG